MLESDVLFECLNFKKSQKNDVMTYKNVDLKFCFTTPICNMQSTLNECKN